MPENPTIDLNREDELDLMQDKVEEAQWQLQRALWLEEDERDRLLLKLTRIGWRALRGKIEPDAVEGSVLVSVAREVGELLGNVFERDPDRMERRAERLKDAGKAAKAAELLAKAKAARARIEARRGNG
jgi:hypothetical protein